MDEAIIILFGMTRKIAPFLQSFTENVLHPLAARNLTVRVLGDLNLSAHVDNPRTAEKGQIEAPTALPERFPELRAHSQSEAAVAERFARFSSLPDSWNDGYKSLRNLLHQLHSLERGTEMALQRPARLYLFLRPDLLYHDDLGPALDAALAAGPDRLFVPGWQPNHGLNDRFAIATGPAAVSAYGGRLQQTDAFCAHRGAGLHSERLLAFAIGTKRIGWRSIPQRASRVRIDGTMRSENFRIRPRRNAWVHVRTFLFPSLFAR